MKTASAAAAITAAMASKERPLAMYARAKLEDRSR
jgi:hypothetical protein